MRYFLLDFDREKYLVQGYEVILLEKKTQSFKVFLKHLDRYITLAIAPG